jgi:transposase
VQTRSSLVNTARGLAKAVGERLPKVDAEALGMEEASGLPEGLRQVLMPLLKIVEELTEKIKAADKQLEQMARARYPETELLTQVSVVGTLIALTFVLTVEDKQRFTKSRDAALSACDRGEQTLANAGRSCPSPKRVTYICEHFWYKAHIAFSAGRGRIPT